MRNKTHNEFVTQLKYVQPNLEVIGRYINTATKILVKDKFGLCSVLPLNLIKGHKPSALTAVNKQLYWINLASCIHGSLYDYSKVKYVNNKTKVTIICPIHGEFIITPNGHTNGMGCGKCNNIALFSPSFMRKANIKHNNLYDYSKAEYVDHKTKVCIICPIHGEFWQTPASHLQGSKCPYCVYETRGYSKSSCIKSAKGKLCTLYKIYCWNENESFYKIGRTIQTINRRFRGKIPYSYKVISEQVGDAEYIYDLENKEHRRHKHLKYKPNIWFAGHTECFTKLI